MSSKNKLALGLLKDVIKTETVEGQNTALRIGSILEDIIDSVLTLQDNLSNSLIGTSDSIALTQSAGKVLKDLCDVLQAQVVAISLILQSNDINLDEVQELVDAIKDLQASIVNASETEPGIAEIATQDEANLGTDDNKIITPLKLSSWSGWLSKLLAGLNTAASTVITNSDTILSALGKLQGQITAKWINITSGNDQQVIFNDSGTANGETSFKWNKTSKRLTIISGGITDTDKPLVINNASNELIMEALGDKSVHFGGESHFIVVPETIASGNSRYQVPNTKSSAWKMVSLTETYVEADTLNKRWNIKQELNIDQGYTPRRIKQGGGQSTSATAIVLETIATSSGDVITVEAFIVAKTSGAAQTMHHVIRRRFKNVAGTVTALGTLTQVEYSLDGFTAGDGITTGARADFNISGTDIQVRFIGQAALTVDVTSTTERSYR